MYQLILQKALELGITEATPITTALLHFSPRIREYCRENKCGNWGKNFMCPPLVGTMQQCQNMVCQYSNALLLTLESTINHARKPSEVYRLADRLHEIVLILEQFACRLGYTQAYGLIAGHCQLCDPCAAATGASRCRHPGLARPSLEALGINVIGSCGAAGQKIEFDKRRVTWVGCLLIQ